MPERMAPVAQALHPGCRLPALLLDRIEGGEERDLRILVQVLHEAWSVVGVGEEGEGRHAPTMPWKPPSVHLPARPASAPRSARPWWWCRARWSRWIGVMEASCMGARRCEQLHLDAAAEFGRPSPHV